MKRFDSQVVKTELEDEEYQIFVDFLEERNLTINEELREAIRLFFRPKLYFKMMLEKILPYENI